MSRTVRTITAILMLVALAAFSLAPAGRAFAQGKATPEDVYRENTEINKMFHKLGRGVVNIFTGWIEIPKQISKEWRKTDPFTGTIVGFVKGLVWGIARTFAGFYEVISFPFPVPRNYEPIMDPEFVLPTVWGERLPLYEDEFVGTGNSIDAAVDYATANKATTTSNSAPRVGRNY